MTASTVKSTKVAAALDSSPRTVQRSSQQGGRMVQYSDTMEVDTTSIDEAADIVLMLPMPSNIVLHDLVLYNDDLDTHSTPTLAWDVGVHNGPEAFKSSAGTSYAAYGAIDADNIATAITTGQSANTAGVNILHEANDIANHDKQLWEIAGLPEDPKKTFVISLKCASDAPAATPAAGTVTLKATGSV
jgi:hypothetical protein